ncbi:MAG TPA: cytochrome c oxidase assembly protein [Acidimicrobiia bacterium]|nr:cytochrome c oxidase assembly protein [Acidimicrobiia bacterium]
MLVAAAPFPTWEPHPDVWMLIGLLVVGYVVAVVRLGPRLSPAGQPVVSRFQILFFGLGVLATWVAADYPVDVIAEESLYSVHVVQHLMFTLVAAPLFILGTPGWLLRWILTPRWLFATVRFLARFLPAVILYNLVLVLAHWPAVVDLTIENELAHFVAHAVLLVSGLIVWLPVLSPLPEIPRLAPIGRMVFLFLQSLVPTIPASFLTFGETPLYRVYERLPHIWGATTLVDQRIAGLLLKLGAGLVLWAVITIVFFRWANDEERADRPAGPPGWQDLGQQLTPTSSRSQ